jgi:hypothetical protein
MTNKQRQSKKAKKNSKRAEVAAKPEDEIDTDNMSAPTEVPLATPATHEVEVAAESQQASVVEPPAPVTETDMRTKTTRSETA